MSDKQASRNRLLGAFWAKRVLAVSVTIPLAGCISRPNLVRESFTFSTPASRLAPTGRSEGVLEVQHINIAAPFAGQLFVYRTGSQSYEQDPYADFLVPPAESLAGPLRAYFRNAGCFGDVVEPDSALKPNHRVEVSVSELYGDFRKGTKPAAVLTMRFVFLDVTNDFRGRVLAERNCSRRVPLKGRTAAGVMAGWDEALRQIMVEVSAMTLGSVQPTR